MSITDRTRIEEAVEILNRSATNGDTLFAAIEFLKAAGYTHDEVRLALYMFMWNAHRLH
jgi:hypothetical protein